MLSEKRRNILLITVCYLVYGCSYFLKYSYNSNIDMMIIKYSITKGDAGLVTTLFFIAYGIGQFVNAILSRKINIKVVLPIVLGISSLINIGILFIPVNAFGVIKYMWCVNGFLLSILWPCTIRVLSENISNKYKDVSIIIFGSVTAVGTSITYLLSAIFKAINHFELIYIASVIIAAIAILLWILFYKKMTNKPEEDESLQKLDKVEKPLDLSLFIAPTIGFVIVIGFISLISALGREGIQTWFPIILEEKFGTSESFSTLLTILFPFAGIIAVYLSVVMNKKIKNYFILCGVYFLVSILGLCLALIFDFSEIVTLVIATVLLSLCCSAIVNITTSMIPLRIKNAKNSGLYAGIFNGCLYGGTAIVTYGLGAIAEDKGWNFTFILMLIFLLIGVLALFIYLIISKLVTSE